MVGFDDSIVALVGFRDRGRKRVQVWVGCYGSHLGELVTVGGAFVSLRLRGEGHGHRVRGCRASAAQSSWPRGFARILRPRFSQCRSPGGWVSRSQISGPQISCQRRDGARAPPSRNVVVRGSSVRAESARSPQTVKDCQRSSTIYVQVSPHIPTTANSYRLGGAITRPTGQLIRAERIETALTAQQPKRGGEPGRRPKDRSHRYLRRSGRLPAGKPLVAASDAVTDLTRLCNRFRLADQALFENESLHALILSQHAELEGPASRDKRQHHRTDKLEEDRFEVVRRAAGTESCPTRATTTR